MTWELPQVETLLAQREGWVVANEGDCICITNEDGLDAYLAISGEQILVESILFSRRQIADAAGLNDTILKTHQIFPLTTVAITTVEDEEYYMAFGALSSHTDADSILVEVELLFSNIPGFLDAYESFLNPKLGVAQ